MIIVVDFDGTIVSEDRDFEDVTTPFVFLPYAREALASLQEAGHVLVLSSCRSNRAHRFNLNLDPFFNYMNDPDHETFEGSDVIDWAFIEHRQRACELNRQRYDHMVRWVNENLPDVFAHIDDGVQGKILADLYIDNKGVSFGDQRWSLNWQMIARTWGGGWTVFVAKR